MSRPIKTSELKDLRFQIRRCGAIPKHDPEYCPRRDGPRPEHRSLTAAILGDPEPGRSALDQKRAQSG